MAFDWKQLVRTVAPGIASVFGTPLPEANKAIVYSLVGSLGTMTVTAAAYYHGTTRGSARKDGLISRMAVGGK